MQPTSQKRYLILTVDGVLTSARTSWDSAAGLPDRLNLAILKNLATFCLRLDVEIIMAAEYSADYPTAEAWCELFVQHGVRLPVVVILPAEESPYIYARDNMNERHPDAQWVIAEAEGYPPPGEDRCIVPDGVVGLSPLDLLHGASVRAPDSDFVQELTQLLHQFDKDRRHRYPY
jgi:hypothetical protein